MSDYITKDSGEREEFATGARRDTQDGKPQYSLIPVKWLKELALRLPGEPDARIDLVPIGPLLRLAALYGRGAKKYGEGNFEKGIPFKRVWDSMERHAQEFRDGEVTEDHLAAVAWNAFALMFYQSKIASGDLPGELDDLIGKRE